MRNGECSAVRTRNKGSQPCGKRQCYKVLALPTPRPPWNKVCKGLAMSSVCVNPRNSQVGRRIVEEVRDLLPHEDVPLNPAIRETEPEEHSNTSCTPYS